MFGSLDTVTYSQIGFDNKKYVKLQRDKIVERIDRFKGGRLYLEIGGGKILHDPHASRVLPGFLPDNKKTILKNLSNISEMVFCVNARDIMTDRQLSSKKEGYSEASIRMVEELHTATNIKPVFVVTLVDTENEADVDIFIKSATKAGYKSAKRYVIKGYPQDLNVVVSSEGYGSDDYIEFKKPLIIVTGAASNSGKLSTALGQLYQDYQRGKKSGYAKFELFPIWSLPLEHPVNLAYEAATADIGDFNVIDKFHLKAYSDRATNYNRDVEAFPIIKTLADKIVDEDSAMRKYNSPTDMGINMLGKSFKNDEVVCVASLREIRRRSNWYSEIVARGQGDKKWIERCLLLERKAKRYIKEKGYDENLII